MATEYRIVARLATSGVRQGRQQIVGDLGAIDAAASRTKAGLLRMFGGAALIGAITKSVKEAAAFETKIAEVSTLVDEATFDMDALTQSALDQSAAFGSMPAEQAAAQYQIISAGAGSAAEATATLTAANKLAVGGVTDVATAADGLTSVMNAYGPKVEGATAVSDALFVSMRAGKTTIAELSNGLGKVAPIAATVGVGFDELAASVSALTKGGISTQESITGVRAILAAVAKPTSEAAEMAASLGLEFNAAAIEAKGFQGFIEEVAEKTGGSTEKLAQLFGGVEALVPIMALAGQAGIDFNAIMEQMREKSGQTDAAFEKITKTAGFQFNQLMANLTVKGIEFGNAVTAVMLPALNFLNGNLSTVINLLGTVVAAWAAYKLAVLAAVAIQTIYNSTLFNTVGVAILDAGATAGATAAKIAFAGASAFATTAVRGLALAITASPLAPLAIALTVAGAAFAYLTGQTNAASDATLAKAEADAKALELENARAQALADLAQMTAIERAETIAKARAAYQAAEADREAARAALIRARAEAQLAASIAKKASTSALSGNNSYSGIGGTGLREQLKAAKANRRVAELREEYQELASHAVSLNTSLGQLENWKAPKVTSFAPTPATVSGVGGGGGATGSSGAAGGGAANDNRPTTTFKKIEDGLKRERDLARETGIEREIMSEKLRAQDGLRRKLTATEAESIDSLIREADAIERQAAFKDQVLGDLDREAETLTVMGIQREILVEQMRAEDVLGRKLTETEAGLIEEKIRVVDLLDRENQLFKDINGPLIDHIRAVEFLNERLDEAVITREQYNIALAETALAQSLTGVLGELGGEFGQDAEAQRIELSYLKQNEIIESALGARLITETRFKDLSIAVATERDRKLQALRRADRDLALKSAGKAFSDLAGMTKEAVGEQSAAYKALFAISKAFAIAEAVINIQRAIASALASGATIGEKIAAVGIVIAQAASIVSSIKSVSLAFADGGYVSGPGGPRDDRILARLSAGEYVVNAAATARNRPMLEAINSGRTAPANDTGGGGGGNGRVIQIGSVTVVVEGGGNPKEDGDQAAEAFVAKVREIARDEMGEQSRGGGLLTQTGSSALAS